MAKVGSKPKTKNKNGKRPEVAKALSEIAKAQADVPASFTKMETIAFESIAEWRTEKEKELQRTIAELQGEYQRKMAVFTNEVIASRGLTEKDIEKYTLDVASGTFSLKEVEETEDVES